MQEDLLAYVPSENALQGRVILVTGAAAGMGKAIAKACAQYGATVVMLDKEVRRAEETYDEIVNAGYPEPAIYPLDMQGATAKDYDDLANNIREQLGRLDGLMLNAAWLSSFTPIKSLRHRIVVENDHGEPARQFPADPCLPAIAGRGALTLPSCLPAMLPTRRFTVHLGWQKRAWMRFATSWRQNTMIRRISSASIRWILVRCVPVCVP